MTAIRRPRSKTNLLSPSKSLLLHDPWVAVGLAAGLTRGARPAGAKCPTRAGPCGYFFIKDDKPEASYYLSREHTEHLSQRDYWKDTKEDIIFIRHAMVCNAVKLPDIVSHLEETATNPHQGEVLELMIHEQYFYPDYGAYIPEYAERCETAIQWCTENDYKPVFYSNGFIGTPE